MFRCVWVIVAAGCVACGAAQTDDFSWIRGANYVPSYARNDVEIWMDYDSAVIDRELGFAQKMNLNCVRVFLQVAVYERDSKRFLANFENMLSLCAKHKIKMMPVLFDSCFGDFPDLERYREKDWMASPGQNRLGTNHWPALRKYVADIVGAHKDDPRIVMWDVMNEPTCTSFYRTEEDKQRIHTFLRAALDWVKAQKPSQPRTVGLMFSGELGLVQDQVDVLGFHNYRRDLREDIQNVRELGRKLGKPIVINEVVRNDQPATYAMPALYEEKIGWCFWELMLGNTQFSRGDHPIQGMIYPDGTCRDVREVAAVMNVSTGEAARVFPQRVRASARTEDGITFSNDWTRWEGSGPRNGRLFYATSGDCTATFAFQGTGARLIHKTGPDCGIAEVLIDGKPAPMREVDTYSADVEWNHVTSVATGLAAGKHTLTVRVTGQKQTASAAEYVQIVGTEIIP